MPTVRPAVASLKIPLIYPGMTFSFPTQVNNSCQLRVTKESISTRHSGPADTIKLSFGRSRPRPAHVASQHCRGKFEEAIGGYRRYRRRGFALSAGETTMRGVTGLNRT